MKKITVAPVSFLRVFSVMSLGFAIGCAQTPTDTTFHNPDAYHVSYDFDRPEVRTPDRVIARAKRAVLKRSIASETPLKGFYNNANAKVNGQQVIPAIEMITGAEHSIDIEIYEMQDLRFIAALDTAIEKGVKVRIVKDNTPVSPPPNDCQFWVPEPAKAGTSSRPTSGRRPRRTSRTSTPRSPASDDSNTNGAAADSPTCTAVKALVAKLNADPLNPGVVRYNKQLLCGLDGAHDNPAHCYEHGKMIIVDGVRVLMSTGNFNASNLCDIDNEGIPNPKSCNRDFSYVSSDEDDVNKLQLIYDHDFKAAAFTLDDVAAKKFNPDQITLKDNTVTTVQDLITHVDDSITVSPYSLQPLIDFISQATTHLQIENQYLKQKDLNAAIIAVKKKQGDRLKVEVMETSLCAFGAPKKTKDALDASYSFSAMAAAGIQLKVFTSAMHVPDDQPGKPGLPGYLHAKAIVIDDSRAWIGSVNGSDSALSHNREFGKFFNDKDGVQELSQILKNDFNNSKAEAWDVCVDAAAARAAAHPRGTHSATTDDSGDADQGDGG
jgi:phosphatidylserine/phosphatidylglycerophosphate/cardiolipin synthase-like enzyme